MELLICIASHNPENRVDILRTILNENMHYAKHVIIDTNKKIDIDGAEIVVNKHLTHPYHLTWCHRKHILDNINNYDWFMYQEDDILIPRQNFYTYIENFNLLWNRYIPSFVRVEEHKGKKFVVDITCRQSSKNIITYKEKNFIKLDNPYHAFWIMSREAILSELKKNFDRKEEWRELAASYPMWELKKEPLVMVENGQISPLCYSYHLSNNYATNPSTPFGKIEIESAIE